MSFLSAWERENRAFVEEVRSWLDEHLVGQLAEWDQGSPVIGPHNFERRLAWERELGRGGWLGLGFPAELGGRPATAVEQMLFGYEYARSAAPVRRLTIQGTMIGPALVRFGTEEQKRRFVPDIVRANTLWCQGFSEPNAGSDLASLQTRAELRGNKWIINGQKVWTSGGHYADWMYALARTSRDKPRHQGISMLLVPLDQPGIEVRPIRTMSGHQEFAEVFFTDAQTSADLVLGDVDGGWPVAMSVLGGERGPTTLSTQLQFEKEMHQLIEMSRKRGLTSSPVARDRITRSWIGLQILGYLNQRNLEAQLAPGSSPSPESSSITKLFWSNWHRHLGELKVDLLGPEGMCTFGDDFDDLYLNSFYLGRAETIYGGTSEIQRNTVGERVLGLPREPRG
jgi:alkylation response protein AidB-like acyl-CoA dehydrogenase